MPDKPPQDIHNEQPNQGAQGTFHGPVNFDQRQTHIDQRGQHIHGDQHNTVIQGTDPATPADRDTYLTHLLTTHTMLQLPDGREVELERIYVSLKADRMNAAERQAEHDFYLEDVEVLWQLAGIAAHDQHAALDAMCKVIARRPRMRMFEARSWQQLFGEPEQRILSLAEVVQQQQAVVLLGDPGSGKTTLGRWLVLQYAGALQRDDERVTVRADHVRPGAKDTLIDLDRTRLPIPIRIADYARIRWGREPIPDLALERFVERGLYHRAESLPAGMTPAQVGALAQAALAQGQALVVLDGLDEVGDLRQRQAVMHAIQDAIQSWRAQHPDGNRVVLTSRIVGYQFHPLTHLPHYTVEDMDDTAITAFCHAWMRHVAETDPDATDAQAQLLANAIIEQAQPGVRVLAGNPLLLTILAQVYWQSSERALPTRRVDLFDAAANALYDQRERFWDNAGIPRLRLYRALAAVAAYLHADEVTGFAEEGSIRAQLATVLPDSEQVEAVLAAAREVSGFLVERGGGVYGFLHRALQEFFAARYLVDEDVPPAERLERLRTRLLDPTWREPLVLAVGWVSRRRYPDSRRLLPQVFDALLDTPDPAGAVLPRRELLAAAACAECERVPPGVGQRIAARMLSFAARREEREVAPELQQRIRQAFAALRDSFAHDETRSVVCAALQAPDFEQRYAAIDLVIELEWDAPVIVQALITVWLTYPDPAASMLVALEGLHERHPDWFTPVLLPFRQAVEQQPALWQHIQHSERWQQVIRLLYLPPLADLEPEQIVRDSPLTPQLLAALHQPDNEAALTALCDDLLPTASQQGSALARDAALLLSAAGDTRWIADSVAQSDPQGTHLRPIAAVLALALALALARDLALALALARARDLALDLARARARALDRARDLDLARDLARARLQGIESALANARIRWQDDTEIMAALDDATGHLRALRALLASPAAPALHALADAWEAHAPPPQEPAPAAEPDIPLSSETLPTLVAHLAAADDRLRQQARTTLTTLTTNRPASALGKELIEQMARLSKKHTATYQIGTQLEWALHCIEHDRPDWLRAWIGQAAASADVTPARTILRNIHRITPEGFAVLLAALPGDRQTTLALLRSLGWLARQGNIPEEHRSAALEQLSGWLATEADSDLRRAIIEVLGHWRSNSTSAGRVLLARLDHNVDDAAEKAVLYESLARCAARASELHEQVAAVLTAACPQPEAAAALVRLLLAKPRKPDPLLELLAEPLPEPLPRLTALLDAGVDDDLWEDDYHDVLARAVRQQMQESEDTEQTALVALVRRLQTALAEKEWEARRIALAAVAACAVAMPTAVQRAAQQVPGCDLEALLVEGAGDPGSHNSRRFAITALSHLRTVTPAIVPALLAGCKDNVEVVQRDTIAAAGRFQSITGDLLPDLVPALTGESVSTAYAVTQLLGALGASAAGEAAGLRDEIITALVDALAHEGSQREVVLFNEYGHEKTKGTLADTLYAELLRVAGWPA